MVRLEARSLAIAPEVCFSSMFSRHYPHVFGYAARRVGSDGADDVANDVFMTAWRRIGDVPGEPDTLAWLYGVARRAVLNHERSHRRRRRLAAKAAALAGAAGTDDPGAEAGSPRVLAALERLRPSDQEVLRLHAWEDLEPRHIAVVLGCSAGAAAVRLHRARRRLVAALSGGEWTS